MIGLGGTGAQQSKVRHELFAVAELLEVCSIRHEAACILPMTPMRPGGVCLPVIAPFR